MNDVLISKEAYILEIIDNDFIKSKYGNLDLEDLKRIRKVIRKAIKEHENNKSV